MHVHISIKMRVHNSIKMHVHFHGTIVCSLWFWLLHFDPVLTATTCLVCICFEVQNLKINVLTLINSIPNVFLC
jgi:hypothetical protein